MNLLTILSIGLIAGFLAGKIVVGHGFGTLGDMAVGAVGALVGAPIFAAFGAEAYGFLGAILMSTSGAVVFLAVANVLRIGLGFRRTA
ncbi:MAG: GlsB/YeaQ/YmgE family stress response membrane protein [Deltaproteobacteria bacterium]|nr:GlsB/YeaQ/YmgE family stress response membrane protein [Deltaproteobacteria bacterium]